MRINLFRSKSKDLFMNDIFYKTSREETRIPYEVLSGIRTLNEEDKEIQNWLQKENQINIKYVFRGRCINVEHGHYLEGVVLYISKDAVAPDNEKQIKLELYERFRFVGIDSKEHKEWGIAPEEAIFFLKLEDEFKKKVDNFIYDKMKIKAILLGARLEFTSFDLARRCKQDYEYRLCYPNEYELKKHNKDGSNQWVERELEKLIVNNNYVGIYDDISPMVRFIIRRA
jgi:hypothetical protein